MSVSAEASSSSISSPPLPRHDFFQSDEKFTLSIYVKGLQPSEVSVSFRERAMKLTLPSGTYDISPFPHPINTEKSTYRVASVKIEISLVKQDVGIKWAALTGEGEGDRGFAAPKSTTEGVPPAVKRQQKDWSKLADEAIKGPAEGETGPTGGDEAVNDLFKSIYANADEDSRRAMIKSMQESGGTTLSTNWADIGKKKTEIQAPSGMTAKKWEI